MPSALRIFLATALATAGPTLLLGAATSQAQPSIAWDQRDLIPPPTIRWNAGVGISLGTFGQSGDYARDERAEGGLLIRVPVHLRIGVWEAEAAIGFHFGNSDGQRRSYRLTTKGLHAKRYVRLGCDAHRYQRGDTCLELYGRAGLELASVDAPSEDVTLGIAYGGGLRLGLRTGRPRRVKHSMSVILDVGRMRTLGGPTGSAGNIDVDFITLGFGFLGLGA